MHTDAVVCWQIGSATGRIGDPSGRSTERVQQTNEHLNANISGLTRSVNTFFQRAVEHASTRLGLGDGEAALEGVNVKSNIDWFKDFSMIEFLRVVGVHARVNTMMNRERCDASHTILDGRLLPRTASKRVFPPSRAFLLRNSRTNCCKHTTFTT